MSEPKFTGVWIPTLVFKNHNLSITAKVVFGVLEGLDNESGCFASNSYLSAHLGLQERQIRNVLKELEDENLIVREEINGHRTIRTIINISLVEAKNCLPHRQKIAAGGGKKLPTYNKVDNKDDKDTGSFDKKGLIEKLDSIPWVSSLPFESEAFSKAWQSWIDYRKQCKKPIKPATISAQWEEFKKWGEDKSIFAIQQSILNGWFGIFEPKKNIGNFKAKPLTAEDHNEF